jgi:adenylate kinase family enzyme
MMRRVLVVAMSGAGKTTAARRIAHKHGLVFHEMDVLAIGPGWSTRPDFVPEVERIVGTDGWVIDSWGYPEVRELMWSHADTVVWLDYPRRVVLTRLLRRSLRRSWSRRPVFGGNRERWRDWRSRAHPFWHAVTTFDERRHLIERRTAVRPHLTTHRFRSPRELEGWLGA